MNQLKRLSAMVDEIPTEEFLELPHDDFTAYCRLCFSVSQLEPLFANEMDANVQLISLIELCTGIKLSAKTDMPSSICLQCRLITEEFLNFRKLCQRLNRLYRKKRDNIILAETSAPLEYQQEVITVPSPMYTEAAPMHTETYHEVEHVTEEPLPMDGLVESCTFQEADQSSAMEASSGPPTCAEVTETIIVHELSDDDDVQCTSVAPKQTRPIEPIKIDKNSEPYLKMANDWFCCKLCSRLYQSFTLLADHFREIHPQQAYLLRTKQQEQHFQPKESEVELVVVNGRNYFKCDLCDSIFTQKRNITRHRWRYHGTFDDCWKTLCKVPGCGQFFMEKKALSRHVALIHTAESDGKAQEKTTPFDIDQDDVAVV